MSPIMERLTEMLPGLSEESLLLLLQIAERCAISDAESPNAETRAALAEYELMKSHPELYPTYSSVDAFMAEVLADADD